MDRPRMNQESANGVPLSSRMLDLLALIITAIDLRRDIIDVPSEPRYAPQTCCACSGTGQLMVPIPEGQGRDDDDESYVNAGLDDDDDDDNNDEDNVNDNNSNNDGDDNAPAPTPGVVSGVNLVPTTVPVGTIVAPSATSAGGCSGAASAGAGPSSGAGASSAAGPPAGTAAVSFGAGPSSAAGPPAGAAAISFSVPAPVVPISGIHPLPPNTPVPTPDQAVYANPGATRYYTVTRGLRVGVFEGWPRVSPYVTGVQRAVYSRHRTLQEAYDAYCIAYAQGGVRYA